MILPQTKYNCVLELIFFEFQSLFHAKYGDM